MSHLRISSPDLSGDRIPAAARDREPRVRDRAREAVVLMVFSAGVSVALTLVVLLGSGLGR
ncbi:hypothetical protein [Nocardioides sambongensis]|uniref:hypothetical protein n=1 Tax=Nocardioides sambongensis TaxID=2589074 RepID=UPI0015E84DAB|nr:hypothetical protein [Nocardioides sambongensis]